ncbi:MAG: hypothetical protein RLZZ308_149 [Candidatus Parcubacteria bacterium]|jgi:hypothetical protein
MINAVSFLKKVATFVLFHGKRNPQFLLHYSINFLKKDFSFDVLFYSGPSLGREIEKGRSLIRIGDGEICMMNGGDVHYQHFEKEIQQALLNSVWLYTDSSPYVICINEHVMNKTNTYLKKHNQFRCWLPMKTFYDLFFNKQATYGDASIFGYKNEFENNVYPYLKKQGVIIVTKKKTIESLQSNTRVIWKNIGYVYTPEKNAYDEIERIRKEIDELIQEKQRESIKPVVIVSCGPASKMLVYEYTQKGVQAIDVGIGLELIFSERETPYILLPKGKM